MASGIEPPPRWRPQCPGLLIVEGNARRLRAEGHTRVNDEVQRALGRCVQGGQLRLQRIPLTSARDLATAKMMAEWSTYDAVVILAHGGPSGVEIAPGLSISWQEVAESLAPTEPKLVVAIACFGGLNHVCDALFRGIPSLRRVVGSPAPLTIREATLATFEAVLTALGAEIPQDASVILNVINALATKGVVLSRTRHAVETTDASAALLEDLIGILLWAALHERGRGGLREPPGRVGQRGPRRLHPRKSGARFVALPDRLLRHGTVA